MEKEQVFGKVIEILTPYTRNKEELDAVSDETKIIADLNVNSSRLVDVVLQFEDNFDIEIEDEEVETVTTVGKAVDLILKKVS
jgi:acyl carrier protein